MNHREMCRGRQQGESRGRGGGGHCREGVCENVAEKKNKGEKDVSLVWLLIPCKDLILQVFNVCSALPIG